MRAWWVQEMLVTPSPLTERMALFWHNHFVSSQQKVRTARLLYGQNAMLRANALGNFGTLLHAAGKDPAMLLYLDSAQNRRGQPNENFAREVMELFTVGEGHYTEQDIKEAARAFTGWSLNRETGDYMFRPGVHDYGVKTVLGKSGNFDGDAVLDILLAQPSTAEFVTTKLWREFVSPDPDAREVARIAQTFRSSNYDIKVALRALLLSDAFWARENRGTLVKSPIEFVVGTLRQLEIKPTSGLPFAVLSAGMGQNLFSPPNVKGWPGGNVWIDTNTLLARKQFVDRLARGDEVPMQVTSMQVTPLPATAQLPDMRSPADSGGRSSAVSAAPKQALAPLGVAGDEKARAQRLAREVDRGLRNVNFDAKDWLGVAKRHDGRAKGARRTGVAAGAGAAIADQDPETTHWSSFARRCRTPSTNSNSDATLRQDLCMDRRNFLRSAAAFPLAQAIGGTAAWNFGTAQVALAAAPAAPTTTAFSSWSS